MSCLFCRTMMEDDMFSPLTQNIDLLAVPCIFMDQGCTIKLKKKEIVEHEKEKCKYRELMCPGCKEKIQARKLPDHFLYCAQLVRREHHQHVHLDETKKIVYKGSKVTSHKPFVFKLDNSYNWFLLCIDRLEDKLVYHVKHYSGEERMETFSYNLKVSNTENTFSRSMSVVCTPFDMEIKDARRKGFTLDISVEAMENMFYWYTELGLFKSYP